MTDIKGFSGKSHAKLVGQIKSYSFPYQPIPNQAATGAGDSGAHGVQRQQTATI